MCATQCLNSSSIRSLILVLEILVWDKVGNMAVCLNSSSIRILILVLEISVWDKVDNMAECKYGRHFMKTTDVLTSPKERNVSEFRLGSAAVMCAVLNFKRCITTAYWQMSFERASLLFRIRKTSGSNLDLRLVSLAGSLFCGFPQSLQAYMPVQYIKLGQ